MQYLHRRRNPRALLLAGLVLAFVLAAPTSAAAAPNPNPGILPPRAHPFERTYGEWSAAWWKYVFSIPLASSPFTDDSGVNCGFNRSGPVFFLVGTFTTTIDPNGVVVASATRTRCTVPTGKALFFPIFNNECSNVEPDPFHADTPAEFVACNHMFVDTVTDLRAEIDGVDIRDLNSYRAPSPIFNITLPPNNILIGGTETVSGLSMADGYYVMVAPLSRGQHTIHFHGFGPAANFAVDVTYAPLMVK